jgi:hypothetical protein
MQNNASKTTGVAKALLAKACVAKACGLGGQGNTPRNGMKRY